MAKTGYQVTCVDIDEKKINLMKEGALLIYEVDFIFIGVRNPEHSDSSVNLKTI